jgi:predicted transcriptional regulator
MKKMTSFRANKELIKKIEMLAETEVRSRSNMISKLLDEAIKHRLLWDDGPSKKGEGQCNS